MFKEKNQDFMINLNYRIMDNYLWIFQLAHEELIFPLK